MCPRFCVLEENRKYLFTFMPLLIVHLVYIYVGGISMKWRHNLMLFFCGSVNVVSLIFGLLL